MRRFGFAIAFFCIFLAGCAPALTAMPDATASLKPVFSPSPSATLAPTSTLAPDTPTPDTPIVTPLPTIPTFTPTFDVRAIVTATPAPKAECPVERQSLAKLRIFSENDELYSQNYIDQILVFLNDGMPVNTLSIELNKENSWGLAYGDLNFADITNDTVSELFVTIGYSHFVLRCESKEYQIIYSREDVISGTKLSLSDWNKNSILELQVSIAPCVDTYCPEMWLYEWDGKKLKTLVHNTDDIISTDDVNEDGITEIIGVEYPWSAEYDLRPIGREIKRIYFWDGYFFNPQKIFADATYRFQVIQDADWGVINGNYDEAFRLYDNAVNKVALEWWSPEREKYEIEQTDARLNFQPTPPNQPSIDPTEYPRLAAYAYYRMVILHTFLGEMEAAQVKYATLQEKFPAGNPGHPYVEMATDFWNAYQSSGKMYNACAAAIAYADAHPEILTPLCSDYHGWQSHTYVPADVCPFR